MTNTTYLQIVHAIYLFSGSGSRCDSVTIARSLNSSPQLIERALLHLETKGLLDRVRVRLTLRGLSVAAALAANPGLLTTAPSQQRRAA